MNKHLFVTVSLVAASILVAPVLAQETCGTHTVIKGETLRSIAVDAYGNAKDYRFIFDANRPKFGISPHIIRIGQVFDLPCQGNLTTAQAPVLDDVVETQVSIVEPVETETVIEANNPESVLEPVTVEITTAEPAPAPEIVLPEDDVALAEPVTETPADTTPDIITLKLVGFADNLPYSDASLLHGGLITTLIETALLRSKAARVDQPTFVFRPETGLATSILPDDYHLSFPWLLPDCKLSEFDADIRDLCENYTFSAPIYEAQMAMYTLADSPFKDAAVEMDLVGARICRPAAMNTYDLLQDGMIEPIISLETATDLAKCFEDLQNDVVDIVSVNGLTADVHFASTGRDEQIVELTARATIHTVHAITRNDNPVGLIAIEYLNAGLWEMLANGEWGEVSKDYLINRLE